MDDDRADGPMGQSLSTAVIEKLASAENVDPETLSPPLFEAIDPDALDRLFRNTSGSVRFVYLGYEVIVEADGAVELVELVEQD